MTRQRRLLNVLVKIRWLVLLYTDVTDAVCDVQCSHYSGNSCQQCNTGHYLENNACYTCSSNCANCYGPESTQCHKCEAGKYGSDCQTNCWGSKCVDNECNRLNGICTNGCKPRTYVYSNYYCYDCPTHCAACGSSRSCYDCDAGYWGSVCQNECNMCIDNACNKSTCLSGCIDGYYLSTDECSKCPTDCITCYRSTSCYECVTGRWGGTCQRDCQHCVDNECSQIGNCNKGCVDGSVYDLQSQLCYMDCTRCVSDACSQNTCVDGCKDGYFWQSDRCSQCLSACSSCSNNSTCLECKDGFYLTANSCTPCMNPCAACTDGVCTGCVSGYYLNGNTCSTCPQSCLMCTSFSHCTACKDGFYFLDDTCNACIQNCESCISVSECAECTNGHYGKSCTACPNCKIQTCEENVNCNQEICDSRNGTCLHGCDTGWFGDTCNLECSIAHCNECVYTDGGLLCSICVPNYYKAAATTCSLCSSFCLSDSQCNGTNGACPPGGCADGWQGDKCDRQCPAGCTMCNQDDGVCTACMPGKYGDMCDRSCSTGCQVDNDVLACTKADGACTRGCLTGYWTKACQTPCSDGCLYSNCNSTTGECVDGCMPAYFGVSCDSLCSSNCLAASGVTDVNICARTDGRCNAGCRDGYHGETCDSACSNCLDTICHRSDGACVNGCASGYTGLLCDEDTPDPVCDVQCSQCSGNSCQQCNTGHYLENNACYTCSSNCANCYGPESTQCHKCEAGKYGSDCQTNCWSSKCVDNECNRLNGICTNGCKPRTYVYSNYYCYDCPTHCAACGSSRSCYDCDAGYWGSVCQNECNMCIDNACNKSTCLSGCIDGYYLSTDECSKCPADCTTCYRSTYCYECVAGRWGGTCQRDCQHCVDNECSLTGKCAQGCVDEAVYDSQTQLCYMDCTRCINNECSQGMCVDGCNNGYFWQEDKCSQCPTACSTCSSTTVCTECNSGFYQVEQSCHLCNSRCTACIQFDVCTACTSGYYLNDKTCIPCSNPCLTCTHVSVCTGCKAGFYLVDEVCSQCLLPCTQCSSGSQCSECSDGHYGIHCTVCAHCTAPDCRLDDSCTHQTCDWLVGTCLHGCEEGWYGDQCDNTCSIANCELCAHGTGGMTCSTCLVNFYKYSEMICSRCSPHCSSGSTCDRITGSCPDGCAEGWEGDMCNTKCSPGCVACHQADGACARCLPGKHGASCEQSCSSECRADNGIVACTKVDGTCTSGCLTGYWTSNCESLCNDGCLNSACNKSTGECLDGCMPEYFGGSCDSRCSSNCLAASRVTDVNICARTDGICNAGCRDGYHGETCDAACGNCQHIICHRSNGTCVYGCTSGYIGSLCNEAPVVGAQEDENAATVGAVVGGVVVGIGAIVAVGVYLIIRRRRSSGIPATAMNYLPSHDAHSEAEPVYNDDINAGVNVGIHPTPPSSDTNASSAVFNPEYEQLSAARTTHDVTLSN